MPEDREEPEHWEPEVPEDREKPEDWEPEVPEELELGASSSSSHQSNTKSYKKSPLVTRIYLTILTYNCPAF